MGLITHLHDNNKRYPNFKSLKIRPLHEFQFISLLEEKQWKNAWTICFHSPTESCIACVPLFSPISNNSIQKC